MEIITRGAITTIGEKKSCYEKPSDSKRVSTMTESEPMWNLTVWRVSLAGCLQSLLNAYDTKLASRKRKRMRPATQLEWIQSNRMRQRNCIRLDEWIDAWVRCSRDSFDAPIVWISLCGIGSTALSHMRSSLSHWHSLSLSLAHLLPCTLTYRTHLPISCGTCVMKTKAACFFPCRICFVNLLQTFFLECQQMRYASCEHQPIHFQLN